MDPHQTRLLLVSLERECQRDPRGYLRRVMRLTLLGYAFPFGILLVLGVLAVRAGAFFAHGNLLFGLLLCVVPLGVALWMVVKMLSVAGMSPPHGLRLTQREGRRLLELVASLCRAAHAPRPVAVLVTGGQGVRVVQTPLRSMIGLHRNYLTIGLPVMLSLSPEELLAVIAHEICHFSRLHGGFPVWVYSMRVIWQRLRKEVGHHDDYGTCLMRWFAGWYSPLLNISTYLLVRRHELATDRLAARLAGAEHMAQALVRLRLADSWLEHQFWPGIRATARRDPRPPNHVFTAMARSLGGMPQSSVELLQFLSSADQGGMVPDDPHPSVAERVKALGQPLAPPVAFQRTAAQEFLGQSLAEVEHVLSDAWRGENEQEWELAHAEAQQERKRLEVLETKYLARTLTQSEAWERASLLQREGNTAEFEHAAREIVAKAPLFAPALYAVGRALLARGNEEGLAYLDRAMEVDESGGFDACQAAQAFLCASGRIADAQRYAQRAAEFLTLMERARAERQGYTPRDPIEPHGAGTDLLESIKTQLSLVPGVREAYLVRKRVSRMRGRPMYVLGVHMERTWWRLPNRQARSLREELERTLELPGDWVCVIMELEIPGFISRFKNVAGEPVYVRQ